MRILIILLSAVCLVAVDATAATCPMPMVGGANVTDATDVLEVVLVPEAGVDRAPLAGTIQAAGMAAPVDVKVERLSPRRVLFTLPQVYAGGTTIHYTLSTATYTCTGPATVAGDVVVQGNEQAIEDLLGRIAYAKTADEKDIFGSFVAARGDAGRTAGAADIVINRDLTQDRVPNVGSLFDTAFTTIRVKKTSAEKADPRAFDASVTLQKTLLLGAARDYLVACSLLTTQACIKSRTATDTAFTRFFRAVFVDEALTLESDAFAFESVNFVSDTHVQLGSQAKAVGNNGYLSVRFHAGTELGRNLQKPTTSAATANVSTMAVDWVRRVKAGGEITFRFLPGDNTGSNWAVEVSARGVARRLLADEVVLEQITNANNEAVPSRVSVGKGTKSWREVDAKIFLFASPSARYGLRLAYMTGALPPTFKPTNGFTFGFVVETADDASNDKPANAVRE